jgi:hypothetical protein
MPVTRRITADLPDRTEWVDSNEDGPVEYGIDWKPGSRPHNHRLLEQKLDEVIDGLRTIVTNWPTMTAAQKDAANRTGWRVVLNLVRYIRGVDSAGNGA